MWLKLWIGRREKKILGKREIREDNMIVKEEIEILIEERNKEKMRIIKIEIKRERKRILKRGESLRRWIEEVEGWEIKIVGIVLKEVEKKKEKEGIVGRNEGKGLRIVKVDIEWIEIIEKRDEGRRRRIVIKESINDLVKREGMIEEVGKEILLKKLEGEVILERNIGGDVKIRKVRIEMVKIGIGIVKKIEVKEKNWRKRIINVLRSKIKVREIGVGGEENEVIEEEKLMKVIEERIDEGIKIGIINGERRIGNVDGVLK